MTVINTVAAKARAISSGAANSAKAESSRESARERLQLLGIGDGTVTRFPSQILPDVRLDDDESVSSSEYPDISEIYVELADKPVNWEREIDNFPLETHAPGTAHGVADEHLRPVTVADTRTLAARRKRVAADQLKHFHIYSGSLVAVLLCSAWMFGFAMFA